MSTIQRRLTLVLAITGSLLGTVGGSALYMTVRKDLVAGFDSVLKTRAEGVAAFITEPKTKPAKSGKPEALEVPEHHLPSWFQLLSLTGESIERSPSLGKGDLPRPPSFNESVQFWDLTLPDGLPARAVGLRFVPQKSTNRAEAASGAQAPEEFVLLIARHRGGLDQALSQISSRFIMVGAFLFVANLAVVILVVRKQLRSLSSLAAGVATIEASSLQTRFPAHSLPGELRPICERLNDLLARLEASFNRERRFTADAAHELRTPIAELRSLAEVALKYPGDNLSTRQALQDALAVAGEMESVTTGLLALARCEAGLLQKDFEPVSLWPLCKGILAGVSAQVQAKEISLSIEVPKDSCWLSDVAALRVILTNLVTNALEYTPQKGVVRILSDSEGEIHRLCLSNTAIHLVPEDLPYVFERFWRKDACRSSKFHSGLGLPLAKALAESVGLQLRAELSGSDQFIVILSGGKLCTPTLSKGTDESKAGAVFGETELACSASKPAQDAEAGDGCTSQEPQESGLVTNPYLR
jgi:two-component system sensor histidine kinase QseC